MTIGERHAEVALADHRDSLYARLELGYARIARAWAEGQDTTVREAYWVALLREYERVCAELTRELAV